jgi:hypothetical protein
VIRNTLSTSHVSSETVYTMIFRCLRCNYGNRIMCIVLLDCCWFCIWFTSNSWFGGVVFIIHTYTHTHTHKHKQAHTYLHKKGVAAEWRSRILKLTNFGLDWITTGCSDGPPFDRTPLSSVLNCNGKHSSFNVRLRTTARQLCDGWTKKEPIDH